MPTKAMLIVGLAGSGSTPSANRVAPKSEKLSAIMLVNSALVLIASTRVEVGLERRGVELLEPRFVHVAGVERAELAVLRRAGDDRLQPLLVAVVDLRADAVLRLVGRDLVGVHPGAAGVALEIVARLGLEVARAEVDAPAAEADAAVAGAWPRSRPPRPARPSPAAPPPPATMHSGLRGNSACLQRSS